MFCILYPLFDLYKFDQINPDGRVKQNGEDQNICWQCIS